MTGVPLRFDGGVAGGVCQLHGAYDSKWERTWLGVAKGVLACVCPTCRKERQENSTITIPDQSIPRILPRVRSTAKGGRKALWLRIPRVAVDALDLACLDTAGSRTLSELRGNAFAAAALTLADMPSDEITEGLYELYKNVPDPLIQDRVNLRLSLAEGQADPVQKMIARLGSPQWITAFGICLLAWCDTFEMED